MSRNYSWTFTESGDGLDSMIRDLDGLARGDDTLRERLDAVTDAFTESLRTTMPVRTGRLRSSGYWTSQMTGDRYEAEVNFGGAIAPYGLFVVGRGVDGQHAWDEVLPAFEPLYESVIGAEFFA